MYCRANGDEDVFNPNVNNIRARHIADGAKPMTPEEEGFLKLFNYEVSVMSAFSLLERRAKREELQDIIKTARVRTQAIDHLDNEEKKAHRKANGVQGFERNLNIDETSERAIKTIKERQTKLSKREQIEAQIKKLYETAGAAGVNEAVKEATSNQRILDAVIKENKDKPQAKPEATKPFINPFAKDKS